MSAVLLVITALGLSMDAFAASLARGVKHPDSRPGSIFLTGAVFGFTEGLMALAGFLTAFFITSWIEAFDHWIALFLLCLIGGFMIHEGLTSDMENVSETRKPSIWVTALTAVGTSIDSAAVGLALGISGTSWMMAVLIGVTTFMMACLGMWLGPRAREALGRRAELAGGLILIGIGLSIFAEHTLAG